MRNGTRAPSLLAREDGIALIVSVLLLLAMSALGLAYMANTVAEEGISFNHRVSTSAFFAANSGVEVMKEAIGAFAEDKLDSLRDPSVYPGHGPIITQPASFFPSGGFTQTGSSPQYNAQATLTFADSSLADTSQVFDFDFTITSTGGASNIGQRRIFAEGRIRVSATRGSFADYLLLTDTHRTPDGTPVWFNTVTSFDGRIHTNDEFRFANSPTFNDLVTSVNQQAWYYNNNNPVELDADRNGTLDVPNFYGGFRRGADAITFPTTSFAQERAALGLASTETALTNGDRRSALGMTGNPGNPIPPGLYIPHSGSTVTGGMYIYGDAKAVTMSVDVQNNQVYRITNPSDQTTTITVARTTNQTVIVDHFGNTTVYTGMPRGCLYAMGRISSLGGPARVNGYPPPSLQRGTQLLVAALGDIVIQSDMVYENYDDGENILGIYSSGGDVRIGSNAPNDLQLDAFLMATAAGKSVTVDNYGTGNYRGQVHLRGGMVSNYYGAFGTFAQNGQLTGYGRDFRYDRRGFVPPYYPGMSLFHTDAPMPHLFAWREI